MASASRFIATTSRQYSSLPRLQASHTVRIRPSTRQSFQKVASHESVAESTRWLSISTRRTRHATSILRSRDFSRHHVEPNQSLTTGQLEDRRLFATTQARSYSAKKESEQDAHHKPSTNAPNTTQPTDPTTPPIAVPQILKRLTPPVVHENIYTLPNFLTTTRVVTAPCISYALLHAQPVLAFTLFAYSSITDLVDGYLARRYNSHTVLGSILDPFADKLLMTLTTISLYSIGTFPWWITLIILGRDAGLLLSALYFRWISLPPPRTMTRYWDFSLPSAEVRPTEISKINTLLQFLLVADAVLLPVLPVGLVDAWNLWGVFEGWMGLVAGTTVWSGLSYIWTKDAIRFIGRDRDGNEVGRKESENEDGENDGKK